MYFFIPVSVLFIRLLPELRLSILHLWNHSSRVLRQQPWDEELADEGDPDKHQRLQRQNCFKLLTTIKSDLAVTVIVWEKTY